MPLGVVNINNPYLIDLLIYKLKLSVDLSDYDASLSTRHYKKIANHIEAYDESNVKHFFKDKKKKVKIDARYFSSPDVLDKYCCALGIELGNFQSK